MSVKRQNYNSDFCACFSEINQNLTKNIISNSRFGLYELNKDKANERLRLRNESCLSRNKLAQYYCTEGSCVKLSELCTEGVTQLTASSSRNPDTVCGGSRTQVAASLYIILSEVANGRSQLKDKDNKGYLPINSLRQEYFESGVETNFRYKVGFNMKNAIKSGSKYCGFSYGGCHEGKSPLLVPLIFSGCSRHLRWLPKSKQNNTVFRLLNNLGGR